MFVSSLISFNSLSLGNEAAVINPLPFRLLLATHSQSDVLFISCSLATLVCIALIFDPATVYSLEVLWLN